MSTPTPTPTMTQTPNCNRVARVSFMAGNSSIIENKACCCPNTIKIKCEDLNINRKYTASVINLGPANGRIYPRSVSFLASSKDRELEFLTQFICDETKTFPTYNTVYVGKISVSSDINIKTLEFDLVNVKWGDSDLDNQLYKLEIIGDKFVVYFDNLAIPSSSELLKFTISISGTSIVSSFKQVIINSTGLVNDIINLISLSNPPNSIGIIKSVIAQNNNGTIDQVLINVPPSSRKLETASITIPSGTVFYDQNNNKLEGNLSLSVTQFSALETDSLDGLPGGPHIVTAFDQQNKQLNNLFYSYSAGFINIQITDAQNKFAISSSRDMSVQTQVNNAIVNPNNNFNTIQSGDVIPLWLMGYDGIWRRDQNITLVDQPSTTGFLHTSFSVSKLGSYNLDWTINGCGNLVIDLSQFRIKIPKDKVVYFDMYTEPSASTDAQKINTRFRLNPACLKSESFVLVNYPDLPIKLTVYNDEQRTNKLGELYISGCGASPSVPVPSPTPSATTTATPTVTPTITISPSQTNLPLGSSQII